MQDRVYEVCAQVFGVPAASLTDDSGPDDIATWDSLSHLQLVVAIEEAFGVTLTPEDAMEMLSVRLVKLVLKDRGAVLD